MHSKYIGLHVYYIYIYFKLDTDDSSEAASPPSSHPSSLQELSDPPPCSHLSADSRAFSMASF